MNDNSLLEHDDDYWRFSQGESVFLDNDDGYPKPPYLRSYTIWPDIDLYFHGGFVRIA